MIGLTIPLKKPTMGITAMTMWKIPCHQLHRHPETTITPRTTTTTMRTIIIAATAILMATWIINKFSINNSEKNSTT